ncbi:MAG: tetratricopeptide repeat protein [Sedimentisphaerales bacterium]|nr:tetratricopeptide repeat protein [Sedimentisphaerales bacterium]
MNSKRNIVMCVLLTIMTTLGGLVSAASTGELLQQGLYAEEVEGNIEQAIKTYGQIISNRSATKNHIAQALYRQGMCYLKTGDEQAAKATLEKLVNDYTDQAELVEKAKPVLADLVDFDPAALMPPDTLVYIELGSPGKQVETILNMLKGTPLENPLAAIGGPQAGNQNKKSPADYMAALLNPSMMAEFKKIRSSAAGVTGITQNNNPPFIAVLYPGKSDALRGILLAIIGASGTVGEPMEGMQTVSIFQNTAAVAYDDKVIIIARPADKLQWSVKQYKGLISEPTLASSNKTFSKLSKQQRQGNAFTAWANVDETYGKLSRLLSGGQIPKEILAANALFDFNHIDYISVSDSLVQDGFSDVTEVVFKEGHNCLAYDLVRTPNISKTAFQAVPADAVALVSFALNPQNENQKDTIRSQIKNVTGLDIGREIFANIEQVTVFVVPPKQESPFFPAYFGIVVTSRNPQQTREILTTILGTANTMASTNPGEATAGRYQVGMVKNTPLYCYLEQAGNATILSLNPDITKAAAVAIKDGNNVCKAGPLAGAVSKLPPTASKLVLVNAGGAIRLAAPVFTESFEEGQRNAIRSNFDQLATAAEKTTIELRTDEQLNGLTINSKLTGLPPLNQVFGPVNQIAGTIQKVKSEAKAKKLRWEAPATIMPTSMPPVIDGNEDGVWAGANSYKIANSLFVPPSSPNDLSASYKAMWDENNLYVLVDVADDVLKNDSGPDQWWFDDSVEVYIDADNSKSNQYDNDDVQYHFSWDRTRPTMGVLDEHGRTENIEFVIVTTPAGYRTEIKFPWATLGRKPATGAVIGLDVMVNDDDNGGERDRKIAWHAKRDNAWQNPQEFGNAALAGMLGWWKFDETEGVTAKDSSGNNHNGTLNQDAKWAAGKIGGAVELNGLGGFVRIADEPAFDIAGQVTIACWVNFRSAPYDWTAIVTKGDSSWRLSTVNKERKFHFSVNDYTRNELNSIILNGSTMVNTNEWHHVAAVYDGSVMRIYVDGKLDASKTWKGGISKNDFDVLIGENAEKKNRFFDGLIDDVRVYNYALPAKDIEALAAGQ